MGDNYLYLVDPRGQRHVTLARLDSVWALRDEEKIQRFLEQTVESGDYPTRLKMVCETELREQFGGCGDPVNLYWTDEQVAEVEAVEQEERERRVRDVPPNPGQTPPIYDQIVDPRDEPELEGSTETETTNDGTDCT